MGRVHLIESGYRRSTLKNCNKALAIRNMEEYLRWRSLLLQESCPEKMNFFLQKQEGCLETIKRLLKEVEILKVVEEDYQVEQMSFLLGQLREDRLKEDLERAKHDRARIVTSYAFQVRRKEEIGQTVRAKRRICSEILELQEIVEALEAKYSHILKIVERIQMISRRSVSLIELEERRAYFIGLIESMSTEIREMKVRVDMLEKNTVVRQHKPDQSGDDQARNGTDDASGNKHG